MTESPPDPVKGKSNKITTKIATKSAKKTTGRKKTTSTKKITKRSESKAGSKAITVTKELYATLLKIQEDLAGRLGGKATFNMVIQSLLQDHFDLQNLKQELDEIQREADQTRDLIKDLLKSAITNQQPLLSVGRPAPAAQPPIVIQYPGPGTPMMTPPPNYTANATVPPQPPSAIPAPPKRKEYVPPPETANIKADYQKEIKAVFTGEVMKPSDILKMAQPPHQATTVKELSKEELEKRQPKTFFAESNPDHFKQTEEEKKAA